MKNVLKFPTQQNKVKFISRTIYKQYLVHNLIFKITFSHSSFMNCFDEKNKIKSDNFFSDEKFTDEVKKKILDFRIECRKNGSKNIDKEISEKTATNSKKRKLSSRYKNDRKKIKLRSSGFIYNNILYGFSSENDKLVLSIEMEVTSQLDVSIIDIFKNFISALKEASSSSGKFLTSPRSQKVDGKIISTNRNVEVEFISMETKFTDLKNENKKAVQTA